MSYQLASSSTEEGEIVNYGFPYYKSYFQYYYYPQSTIFIGKNTLPVLVNYKSDLYCSKLKKDIKADYPCISFNHLENTKTFFENKLMFYKDLIENDIIKVNNNLTDKYFILKNIVSDYKEGTLTTKRTNKDNSYSSFYKQMLFNSKDKFPLNSKSINKIIIIEDRMIEAIDKPNAFIFFRYIKQKIDDEINEFFTKIIFEEIFYNKMFFYEYLDFCSSNIARNFNGFETRFYEFKDTVLIVRSNTVFKYNNKIRRIHNIDNDEKNTQIIFNKNEMNIIDFKGELNDNMKYLYDFNLPEGDYVLNNKKIYQINKEGEIIPFLDIDFSDFIKNRWESKII